MLRPPYSDLNPTRQLSLSLVLPLVSREWKNGSKSSHNCTPFLHSLLTQGKLFRYRTAICFVVVRDDAVELAARFGS